MPVACLCFRVFVCALFVVCFEILLFSFFHAGAVSNGKTKASLAFAVV
jgi:hypothetical protein